MQPRISVDVADAEARKELEVTKVALREAQLTIQALDPMRQQVASVTASVDIFIKSEEQFDNHFMDRGGLIGFCRKDEPLLVMRVGDSYGKTTEKGLAVFHAAFNSPISGALVGKPVAELISESEYIQIELIKLPENAHIIKGAVIVTINGTKRFKFEIPLQIAEGSKVFVRDLSGFKQP